MTDFPRWLKPVTFWLLLGTALFLAAQAWQAREQRARFQVDAAGVIEIRRAPDGHYHWPALVNGQAVDFLVDTGATRSAIPAILAEGLPEVGRFRSETAGGLVDARVVRIDLALEGGVSVRQMAVAVLPDLNTPLLGMDVLSKLKFTQARGVLRLEPSGGRR